MRTSDKVHKQWVVVGTQFTCYMHVSSLGPHTGFPHRIIVHVFIVWGSYLKHAGGIPLQGNQVYLSLIKLTQVATAVTTEGFKLCNACD